MAHAAVEESDTTKDQRRKWETISVRHGMAMVSIHRCCSLSFHPIVLPRIGEPANKRQQAATRANTPLCKTTSPGLYDMEKDNLTGDRAHLVAVDLGIRSILRRERAGA